MPGDSVKMKLNKFDMELSEARETLVWVTNILDDNGIVYHLEGGTLLGLVRNGDLLPWDHDLDISIMSSDVDKLLKCKKYFSNRNFVFRKNILFRNKHDAWTRKSKRIFKIKNRKLLFFTGRFCFDIFVKYEYGGFVYWEAKNKIMRVSNKYYIGYDEIYCFGKNFKVPNNYVDYLTEKYGDWSVEKRDWNCALHELTIVR